MPDPSYLTNASIATTNFTDGLEVAEYGFVEPDPRTVIQKDLERLAEDISFQLRNLPAQASGGFVNGEPRLFLPLDSGLPVELLSTNDGRRFRLRRLAGPAMITTKTEPERRILAGFVQRAIKQYLKWELRDRIWQRSSASRIYCNVQPISGNGPDDDSGEELTQLFDCFRYRIDVLATGRVLFTIDPTATALEAQSYLAQYARLPAHAFEGAYNETWAVYGNPYGNLSLVYFQKALPGKLLSKTILDERKNPTATVEGEFRKRKITLPRDETVGACKYYPEQATNLNLPMSRLRAFVETAADEAEFRQVSREFIMEPQERLERIAEISKLIKPIPWGRSGDSTHTFQPFSRLAGSQDFVFTRHPLPRLRFGSQFVLDESAMAPTEDWVVAKDRCWRTHGPAVPVHMAGVLIVHPPGSRADVKRLYDDLTACAADRKVSLPVDPILFETNSFVGLEKSLDEYREQFDAAIIVFSSQGGKRSETDYVLAKNAVRVPSQGIRLSTVRRALTAKGAGRYPEIVLNTLSGLAGKAGCQPWVLDSELSHDLYVGVDAGGDPTARAWSYSAVFDRSGRFVASSKGEPTKGESIEKGRFRNSILNVFKKLPDAVGVAQRPKSLVVHRDGAIMDTEVSALADAATILREEGLVHPSFSVAALNIRKRNGFRMFRRLPEGGVENAHIGTQFQVDESRVVLNTTGSPTLSQGTAAPLLVELAFTDGAFDINALARDVFYLSELHWGAPKHDTKLPLTVRFADELASYLARGIDFSGQNPV